MKYKILLLTSGVGSRLGNLTKYTNKALVRIGDKPGISYIIDKYDKNIEIIVVLGYFGNQVKDFLEIAYPDRKFQFVWVDNYDKSGSSLVYSLLQAKDKIDCPFIYHACDTLIRTDNIPEPFENWLGGYTTENSSEYTSFRISDNYVTGIFDKGEKKFDFVYTGLAGIHDYQEFFEEASTLYSIQSLNKQLSDIDITSKLIKHGIKFRWVDFPSWLDMGNITKLKETEKFFEAKITVLDKETESIFLVDGQIIKFFSDPTIVSKRVQRAKILKNLVPEITGVRPNFYSYQYVEGELLASIVNEQLMDRFLIWSKDNLWKPGDSSVNLYPLCQAFYFEKTKKRIKEFLKKYNIEDKEEAINGYLIPKTLEMLDSIPVNWLCDAKPYAFHGDYILDNILVTKQGFTLLDWRQDFGGDILNGDIYYDLSKLNHNLIFNHKIIGDKNFMVKTGDVITVDLLLSYNLCQCREKYIQFLKNNNFNIEKIQLLTAIIWLNMSPLHDYPVSTFLYYFGKLNLHKALQGNYYE